MKYIVYLTTNKINNKIYIGVHETENPEVFDERVVEALIQSINILNPGTCIELNTGEKGLVLAGNEFNILRPMVLGFNDNVILDLSNELAYGDIEIVDIE